MKADRPAGIIEEQDKAWEACRGIGTFSGLTCEEVCGTMHAQTSSKEAPDSSRYILRSESCIRKGLAVKEQK